jgi:hypothetical protein
MPSQGSYAGREAGARALSQRKENFAYGYVAPTDKQNSFNVKATAHDNKMGHSNKHTLQIGVKLNGQKSDFTSVARLQQNQAQRSTSQSAGNDASKEQALATKKDLRSVHFSLGNVTGTGATVSGSDYSQPTQPDTLGLLR